MATAIERFSEFYDVDRAHGSGLQILRSDTCRSRPSAVSFAYVDGSAHRSRTAGGSHSRDMRLPSRLDRGSSPEFREHVVRGGGLLRRRRASPLITFSSIECRVLEPRTAMLTVSGELTIRGVSPIRLDGVGAWTGRRVEDPYGDLCRAGLRSFGRRLLPELGHAPGRMPLPDGGEALGWEVDITCKASSWSRAADASARSSAAASAEARTTARSLEAAAAQVDVRAQVEFVVWAASPTSPPTAKIWRSRSRPPSRAEGASFAEADAVLIATPEYNASVPGALKNALDWRSTPLPRNALRNKPVAVIWASQGMLGACGWAQADLRKILKAIGALVDDRELGVARGHEAFADDGRLHDPTLTARLRAIVNDLCAPAVQAARRPLAPLRPPERTVSEGRLRPDGTENVADDVTGSSGRVSGPKPMRRSPACSSKLTRRTRCM